MRSFLPPQPPRIAGRWYLISVAVHVVAIGLLVWVSTHTPEHDGVRLIRLYEDAPPAPRQFTMRLGDPVGTGVEVADADAAGTLGRVSIAAVAINAGAAGPRVPVAPPESLTIGIAGASTTVPGAIVVGTRRLVGPAFGDGSVWQGPPEVWAVEQGTWGPMETELAMRVVDMLDSVMADSLMQRGIPRWMFTAMGQQWGIDQQFIHLGPIKIPTMLLGLLPLPAGNYEAAQQAAWLADVRQQIIRQADQMNRVDAFRDYVKQLRARRLREREEDRRRRGLVASRDSTGADRRRN